MSTASSAPDISAKDNHSGNLIACVVDELKPHPSFIRHQIVVQVSQLSRLADLGDLAFREPLIITRDRTILDGNARWKLARRQGRATLLCVELELTEAEALHWLLQKQRGSKALNAFCRALLALELEPWLKDRARSNQRVGGQNKGSPKLTEAERLDVRAKVATAAGVSAGNVSKVKQLCEHGHPELQQALRDGEVSIHRASSWLLTLDRQLEQLSLHRNLQGIGRIVDSLLRTHRTRRSASKEELDIQRIGTALTMMSAERASSIVVKKFQAGGEVILLSAGLLQALENQRLLPYEAS